MKLVRPRRSVGNVYLVGAGPGDPGLLTIKFATNVWPDLSVRQCN